MKILVTVKEVGSVESEFEIDGLEIDERFLEYDINEWDDYAVEEAVQISESNDDVEVVTVTIGPERAEEVIRAALAKGADRAIRVWDDSLAESSLLDPGVKASILAAVVEREDPDLVLSGVQAGDDANGATGVMVADRIGYNWSAVVSDLDLDVDTGTARVRRELEGGLEEVAEVALPAVLTIQTGINDPRYASLRGIRQAQKKELAVQSLTDLGVDDESLTTPLEQRDMYKPEAESDVTLIEGDASQAAAELSTVLSEEGVIGE